jgi:thiol-disulfide isomerase/thioredoxin
MKKILLAAIILAFFFPSYGFSQGYNIEVTVDGLRDTSIYLAYHFGNKKYVQDTIRLDSQGKGVFAGPEKLQGGIYLVVFPSMTYFEILLSDNQDFQLKTTLIDPVKNIQVFNSVENELFTDYQIFMAEKQGFSDDLQKRLRVHSDNSDSLVMLQDQLRKLDSEVKSYWKTIRENQPDSFLASIIRAMTNIEIPEFDLPEGVSNRDSLKWVMGYNYNKIHYFDNIDFSDDKLLRTPILQNKLEHFFTRMLIQHPDSIIPQAVRVIEMASQHEKVYQYVLVYLLNTFETSHVMGLDEVFVHLAETYYLSGKAPWATTDFLEKLSTRVQRLKPNLIGRVAADLRMQTQQGNFVNLHQVKADFIILYFYEPGCGHCKTVTPQLLKLYDKYKNKGLEVYAVYILDDKAEWIDYTTKNNLNWINVFDPTNASFFRYYYDIYSTPTIYMLDRDKKIIAKRVGIETLEQIIEDKIRL